MFFPTNCLTFKIDLGDISKGAEKFYEPVVQRAVNTFNQQTVPDVITKFGGAAGYD